MFRRMLVAYDGSQGAEAALRLAIDLAGRTEAELGTVSVEELPPRYAETIAEIEEAKRAADATSTSSRSTRGTRHCWMAWTWRPSSGGRRQAAAEEQAGAGGVAFVRVARPGHAAQVRGEEARAQGADLLVLGATGLEHPWSPTIGGTATRLASEAPCPVLLVRPPQ